SANRSTGVSPTMSAHVLEDLDGVIDLVLDDGPCPLGIESTVLDLTADPPRLLRPGSITTEQIRACLGQDLSVPSTPRISTNASSPGQSEIHYAPRTPLYLIRPEQIPDDRLPAPEPIGLIVAGGLEYGVRSRYHAYEYWKDPKLASQRLYATLREWDRLSLHRIDAVVPMEDESWRAVRDRLWRASRRWSRDSVG